MVQNPTIKALLFDLGGVVLEVDFDRVFDAWARISALNKTQIKSNFKVDEYYERHEKGTIEPSGFFGHIRDTLKLTGTDDEIINAWNDIFGAEISPTLDAIEHIRPTIPTYGFSNTNLTHQIYWEKHFPRIPASFDTLFVSSEIGYRKPDAEAFSYILDEIKVKPEELIFFDDSPENIEGAKRMGIQSVLVTDSESVVSVLQTLS